MTSNKITTSVCEYTWCDEAWSSPLDGTRRGPFLYALIPEVVHQHETYGKNIDIRVADIYGLGDNHPRVYTDAGER